MNRYFSTPAPAQMAAASMVLAVVSLVSGLALSELVLMAVRQ